MVDMRERNNWECARRNLGWEKARMVRERTFAQGGFGFLAVHLHVVNLEDDFEELCRCISNNITKAHY